MTGTVISKKLPSGKGYLYIKLNYKDAGKWKSKTISTGLEARNNKRKAEAMISDIQEKYAWLEEKKNTSVFQADIGSDTEVSTYLKNWLDEKKNDLRATTFEAYSYRVERLREYFEKEDLKITEVTPPMMDKFLKHLRSAGKRNQKTGLYEPLSVRSVREYRNLLFAMFNQAVLDGLIASNPVAGVKVGGKRNSDFCEEYLFLTEKEIAEMLHFMAGHYPLLVEIAFFGAYYGLRRSEILGLKWSSFNFERKTLTVKHTVTRMKTVHAEDDTKSVAGSRTLILFETAEKCLKKLQKKQEEDRSFFGNTYKNAAGYVFVREDGENYDPNYISDLFKKAMKEFGRPEITLHKLRHTCASLLIEKGWDVKKVQYWLGHEEPTTTLRIYAHYNKKKMNETEDDLKEITKAVEDLFSDDEQAS